MSRIEDSLPVIHMNEPEELEPFISQSKPCIIKGWVETWPAFTKWQDINYIVNKVGDAQVAIRDVERNEGTEWLGTTRYMPLGEYVSLWQKGVSGLYLASLPLKGALSALAADVVVPGHAAGQGKPGNLWIGQAGQVTPLHHDWSAGDPGMDGLHALLTGAKLFRLFDPLQARAFPRRRLWGRFHQALVDPDHPDYSLYPEYAHARYWEVLLQPGDLLYIPKLWWHHVTTLEPSVAVNFWFQHLESERLKLTRHWPHMEEYLIAVFHMEITDEKLLNVLRFLEVPEPIDVSWWRHERREMMLLAKFLRGLCGARHPATAGPAAAALEAALTERAREWIGRLPARPTTPPLPHNDPEPDPHFKPLPAVPH